MNDYDRKLTKWETVLTYMTLYWDKLIVILLTVLTLKVPIMTAADDIHKYFFIVFQRK